MDKAYLLQWISFFAIQQYVEAQCNLTSPGFVICTNVNSLEEFLNGIKDYGSKTKKLLIQNSKVNYLTSEIFEDVKNVKMLNFTDNKVGSFPAGLFEKLTKLEFINLYSNDASSNIDSKLFSGLAKLKILYLSMTWSSLPKDLFDNLSSLVTLDIYYMWHNLEHIDFNAFKNQQLGLSSLTYLSITSTLVKYLDKNSFRNLNKLQNLRLCENGIISISPGAFIGLSSLTFLDLSTNFVTNLPDGVFQDIPLLKTLKLHHNLLTHLTPLMFEGLKKLNALYLQENHITTIDSNTFDVFKSGKSLEILHLFGNKVDYLPENIFANFDCLNELIFDDRNLVIAEYGIYSKNGVVENLILPLITK